ncbi:MAG: hypothetical protein HC857_06570 [Synechococcales cyanobacterium RU_4_20]|nr:hypothetical protein [Synechococcales cyanobacterium RU_4_20]
MNIKNRIALAGLGVAVGVWLANGHAALVLASDLMAYGDGRGLSAEQAASVPFLQWPQSYEAMINLLGYPDARDEQSDFYTLSDGRGHIRINYSGPVAVSYEWEQF